LSGFQIADAFWKSKIQTSFINHPSFVDSGELLLRYRKVADGEKAFLEFIAGLLPEEFGSLIIDQKGGPVDVLGHR
jgi:hypothetical protein